MKDCGKSHIYLKQRYIFSALTQRRILGLLLFTIGYLGPSVYSLSFLWCTVSNTFCVSKNSYIAIECSQALIVLTYKSSCCLPGMNLNCAAENDLLKTILIN